MYEFKKNQEEKVQRILLERQRDVITIINKEKVIITNYSTKNRRQ